VTAQAGCHHHGHLLRQGRPQEAPAPLGVSEPLHQVPTCREGGFLLAKKVLERREGLAAVGLVERMVERLADGRQPVPGLSEREPRPFEIDDGLVEGGLADKWGYRPMILLRRMVVGPPEPARSLAPPAMPRDRAFP